MLGEYQDEIQRLRQENAQIRYQKEIKERDFESVMFENQTLYTKLENLENVFIGQPMRRENGTLQDQHAGALSQDYQT